MIPGRGGTNNTCFQMKIFKMYNVFQRVTVSCHLMFFL